MKILFTHRYFWPDSSPYGLMLRELARCMAERGYEVSAYTSQPSYRKATAASAKEIDGSVNVIRAKMFGNERSGTVFRVLNSIKYCIGLFIHIIRHRPHIVTAATYPPVIAAFSASVAARIVGAKFIYHMQDIHPEVSEYSGDRLGKGFTGRVLKILDNITLRISVVIVVLSADMKKTIEKRGIDGEKIEIINNPAIRSDDYESIPPAEYKKDKGVFRLIFAGNLGRFQNLDVLTQGVAEFLKSDSNAELVFLGDGSEQGRLREMWAHNSQIKFFPYLPYAEAKLIMKESDIGLVSLQNDIYKVSFPSKLVTYLSLGMPLLVLVEKHSEIARYTVRNRLGVVPDELTADGVKNALMRIAQSNEITSQQITVWFDKNWSDEVFNQNWERVLDDTLAFNPSKSVN